MRFAPAERFVTAALWFAAAASAIWGGIHADAVLEQAPMMAIGLLCLAQAALSLRRYATFEQQGGLDVAGLRKALFLWADVADIHVGRAPGIGSGYCLILTLIDGADLALRGTRVYSRLPSAKHHQELVHLAEMLKAKYLGAGEV